MFTSSEGDPDWVHRKRLDDLIESRIYEGVEYSCRHEHLYRAVDLAWDSLPLNKANIPLMQYAQGKLKMTECIRSLEKLNCVDEFAVKDKDGHIIDINQMRLHEVSINLIRSYINRRLAAQVSKFSNLFPYLKYEPRGTSVSDKLRGDVVSQRMEIMTDSFGYRHISNQAIRDMFLYSRVVLFPDGAWHEDKGWVEVEDPATGDKEIMSVTERAGVLYVKPHPTRVFWDRSRPLPQINDDIGPEYIGYWDVVPHRDLARDPDFWNVDKIEYTKNLIGLHNQHSNYFTYYFDDIKIKFPSTEGLADDDLALRNDSKANVGLYAASEDDQTSFITNLFMKIIPSDYDLGLYPYPVWVRFVVASDNTVLFAEYMPSIPAIYGGINENDDRFANISIAHEIMPFQDRLNDIMTTMLHDMKTGMMKIIAIDRDSLDEDQEEYIEKSLKGGNWYGNPKAFFYSGSGMTDLGVDPKNFLTVVDVHREMAECVQFHTTAILSILNIVERLLILSPQELGQPSPREVSATEITEITNTTNALYSFISEGIDELRSAMKKQLYEHTISCDDEQFDLPVTGRYTVKTIQEAGFDVSSDDDIGDHDVPRRRNVIGMPKDLRHDYLFTSRDGGERPRDTQSAQVLSQMLMQILKMSPELAAMAAQKIGPDRLMEMLNEIFRMSGSGYDLKIEAESVEDQSAAKSIQAEKFTEQLQQQMPEMLKTLQALNQRIGTVESALNIEQPQQSNTQGNPQNEQLR